jgi:hypothetical protein
MTDLEQLRARIEQLETEIEGVVSESQRLQRALRRRFTAVFALTVFATLLVGVRWSLAKSPQAVTITRSHAPFEVDDSSGRKIFRVNNNHSFYVYTEKEVPALIGQASAGDYSFMVAPKDGGPWVKLGLGGSGSPPPAASSTSTPKGGGTGQGRGRAGRGVGQAQGQGPRQAHGSGAQGGSAGGASMTPFLKLSAGGQSDADERIFLGMAENKPLFQMRNTSGIPVVLLLQSHAFQGGALGIQDSGGKIAVRAGASAAGIGRVEAFPLGNPVGSSIVGRIR